MSVFNKFQEEEIRIGQQEGLDISWYSRFEYDSVKMKSIRIGLENGLDPRIYAKPEFNCLQIGEITQGLLSGVDVSIYSDEKYNANQMYQIRKGLEMKLDVSKYLDPSLDFRQMSEIRWGLVHGVDVTRYNQAYIGAELMCEKRRELEGMPVDTKNVEYVKMWEGSPKVLDRSFNVLVADKKQILADKFLCWEDMLSSDVACKLLEKFPQVAGSSTINDSNFTGFKLYNELVTCLKDDDKVVDALKQLGYSGIRYTNKDQERVNLVVFDEREKKALAGDSCVTAKPLDKRMLTKEEISDMIKDIHAISDGNIEVVVIDANMPLPLAVRGVIDDFAGIGCNNCLYVNPDNLQSKEELIQLWVKEVGAKEGLKTLVPDTHLRTSFLQWVWNNAEKLSKDDNNKEVVRIVNDVKERYERTEGNLKDDLLKCSSHATATLGEMFLGDFATSVSVHKVLNKQEKGFWQNISEKFRNIVEKTFGFRSTDAISERDLAKVVACAVKAGQTQKTKIRVVLKDKIKFRREEDNRVANEASLKHKNGI